MFYCIMGAECCCRVLIAVRWCCLIRGYSVYRTFPQNENDARINDRIRDGVAKIEHSREVGKVTDVNPTTVRRWVTEFCKGDSFVVRKRQHNKREAHSHIDDEDIRSRLREYIDRRLYRRKKDEPRLRIADVPR